MMSVMKTKTVTKKKAKAVTKAEVLPTVFTVRDMNRNSAKVLAACRQHGAIIVKHRAGEEFAMTRVDTAPSQGAIKPDMQGALRDAMERMRQHREKIRAMGMRGPRTPEEIERVNMIIAGEI
jgi:hypothetical protein